MENLQLDEPSRSRLDSIIIKMQQNKESENNIQTVVNDFKNKYGKPPVMEPTVEQQPEQKKGLLDKLGGRFNDATSALGKTYHEEINPLSAGLQVAGAVAGGVNDVADSAANFVTGGLLHKATDYIGEKFSKSNLGQSIGSGVQSFSDKHPELSADIGALGNISSVIPVAAGAAKLGSSVVGGVARGLGKTGIESIVSDVSPELTTRKMAKDIAKKGTQKSLVKGIISPATDDISLQTANDIKKNVPNFGKLKTYSDKVNATRDAVSNLATSLKDDVVKGGTDRIYSFKELGNRLNSIERPLMISSDNTLNNAYDRVIAKALDIAREKGGKVSNFLDTRQEFDKFVSKQFPNLYSSDTLTPIRSAIKNIRNGITDFTAENLPEGVGLRERLLEQSRLLDAIENMSTKSAKEVGTNRFGRFAGRHPVFTGLIGKGLTAGLTGAGIGSGVSAYKGYQDLSK